MGKRLIESDYIGKKRNKLTILRFAGIENQRTQVLCECECGTQKVIDIHYWKSDRTKSCGCLTEEKNKKARDRLRTHGKRHTRLYNIYTNMKQRCCNADNKDYSHYGGRGITICDEWANDFQVFYDWAMSNGYSDDLTIDREDNDGNYEPSNCHWVSMAVQTRNTGLYSTNASGHKGISYHKANNKWQAELAANGKSIYLGVFDTIDEAVAARKDGELKYWGKEAANDGR